MSDEDILEVDFEVDDGPVADDMFQSAIHSAVEGRQADSFQRASDNIATLTTDEFLKDAYLGATQLRNTLGDADALVAEICTNIRNNILVVATEIHNRPAELIIAAARTIEDPNERLSFMNAIMEDLDEYHVALGIEASKARE